MVQSYENTRLYDKIYGCLVAGLAGDALGGPSEGMSLAQVEEKFGVIKEFLPYRNLPAGASTDDSVLKHMLCEAIMRRGGHVQTEDWAAVLLESPEHPLYSTPMRNSYSKMLVSKVSPREAGFGNRISNCSPMAIAPIGILNAGNPARAAFDTYEVTQFIDRGPGPDAAAAIAAAVAAAFVDGATPDSVVEAAGAHLKPGSELPPLIGKAMDLARSTRDFLAFRRSFHEAYLAPYISNDPRESGPVALALFWLADGDPVRAAQYGASFGRDADTIATISASIAGALRGAQAIPRDWLDLVIRENPVDQHRLTAGLCAVVVESARRAEERAAGLRKLI